MDLQEQIDALKAEVAELRRQILAGPPRLGPRPPTPAETAAATERLVDAVKKAQHEHETDEQGRQICTTSGEAPSTVRADQRAEGNSGQHKSYLVLCEEERKKGFVRPYRDKYRHAKCGAVTTMARSLSETYARDPLFYDATLCVTCNKHYPVSEFVWTADGEAVGS